MFGCDRMPVAALMFVRRYVPRSEREGFAAVEATKYVRDAVRADQSGTLMREHFSAARRTNEHMRDELDQLLHRPRSGELRY
jgi:hypothetical protein